VGHVYSAATSYASCTNWSAYGPCPAGDTGPSGLRDAAVFLATGWTVPQADVKSVMGDYDRDGRDDVIAVRRDGSGIKVVGLRAIQGQPAFADPLQLYTGNTSFDNVKPVGLNVNPDGMTDLALVYGSTTTKLMWLKSIERSTAPAVMWPMTEFDSGLNWSANNRAF
jgi:hypothetical protein